MGFICAHAFFVWKPKRVLILRLKLWIFIDIYPHRIIAFIISIYYFYL